MTSEQSQTSPQCFQQRALQRAFQVFILSTVIILIGGGVAMLWHAHQGTQSSHALPADVGVSGPPTISAATVNAIFAQMGSPMVGTGAAVEQASRQTNIDDAFALGVWWTETNDGAAGVGSADHNPGSVRGSVGYPSAFDGYTIYPSYTVAIIDWFKLLRNRYVNTGLASVYAIARPYVGTTSYPLWAGKVTTLMYRYRGEAPPPPAITSTPTPKPTPKPKPIVTVTPTVSLANVYRRMKLKKLFLDPANTDFSSVSIQVNTQGAHLPRIPQVAITPQTSNIPTLSQTTERISILFGFLTALAIALYALRIGRGLPAKAKEQQQSVHTDALVPGLFDGIGDTLSNSSSSLPLVDKQAWNVFNQSQSPMDFDIQQFPVLRRETDALPRRIILLPSHTDPKILAATGTPSTHSPSPSTKASYLANRDGEE